MSSHLSFNVEDTLGSAFVGFAASCLFFGVFLIQTWTYYERYPNDRPLYKFLVGYVLILQVTDQVFIGHGTYYYCISRYGQAIRVITEPAIWSLVAQVMLGAVVGAIVKICFALRVWRFSGNNRFVTATLLILVFVSFGFAVGYSVQGFLLPSIDQLPSLKTSASLALGTGALTDILTAASLCFYLRRYRTGVNKKSDSLVNSLMIYAVNSGIITSMASLSTLVTYDLMSNNFIFMGIYFVLSKFYAVSLMATLNTRRTVSGRGTDHEKGTVGDSTFMIGRLQTVVDPMADRNSMTSNDFAVRHDTCVSSPTSITSPKPTLPW